MEKVFHGLILLSLGNNKIKASKTIRRGQMSKKGLSSKLWVLSKSINEKTSEYKKSKKIVKIKKLYVKPKVEKFKYKDGGISYTKSFNNVVKEEWHWKDQFDFIDRVIKQLPIYRETVLEISKKYEVNESQADFCLSRFVQILIQKALEGITDELLVEDVTTLIADLEKSPTEWKHKIWINGVWLEDEEYEIYEGLKIRRPKPSDLEIEIPFDMLPFQTAAPSFRGTSPAILEVTHRARNPNEAQKEIEKILNCLRLFRVGSVFFTKHEMYPKSFSTFGGITSSGQRFASTYKYSIGKEDIPKLKGFIGKIGNLLPKETLQARPEKIEPIVVALQRYNDALLKPEIIESRITSIITCFEALYLKAGERMELSHRLSQRASAVLRVFKFMPLEVYNVLIQAYEIRSTFIHGSQIESEIRKNAHKIAEKTLEYARMSLLIFFQLKHLVDKEKLIGRIDNSILEEQAYSKLKKLLNENCTIL